MESQNRQYILIESQEGSKRSFNFKTECKYSLNLKTWSEILNNNKTGS